MSETASQDRYAEVALEFASVMTEIAALVYAPGRDPEPPGDALSLNQFLNSESCPVMRFLGERMGCGVTRWYFYDRQDNQLQPFHKRIDGGIDPVWMEPTSYDSTAGRFDVRFLGQADKQRVEAEQQAGVRRSAAIFHRWFLEEGKWLRTAAEKRHGWVFVPNAELALGCFEWLLCERLYEGTQSTLLFQGEDSHLAENAVAGNTGAIDELTAHPDFRRVVDTAVAELMRTVCHGHNPDAVLQAIKDWVCGVLRSSPTAPQPDPEYLAWYDETRSSTEWFVKLGQNGAEVVQACTTWEELGGLIFRAAEYGQRSGVSAAIEEHLRFSPRMEMILRSRSVIFFPLWLGRNHHADIVTAPYTAFVIANFFDDRIITDNLGRLIRSLFTFMALPDIIEFGIDSYEARVKAETLELMARGVGHDIQHPLWEALNMLRIAENELPRWRAGRAREYCGSATDAVVSAMRRIENLLDSIRIRQYIKRPTDVAMLVARTVGALERTEIYEESGARIRVSPPTEDVSSVAVDGEKLGRVLENLLLNAMEASPQGDEITVEIDLSEGQLTLAVGDRGPGIPDSVLCAIQRGETITTKARGTGIGLIASKHIVESHGGVLAFSGNTPTGTRAAICIPVASGSEVAT